MSRGHCGAVLCAVLSALQCIIGCLKGALKTEKAPSEPQFVTKYDKVCLVIDEVIHEVCSRGVALVVPLQQKTAK